MKRSKLLSAIVALAMTLSLWPGGGITAYAAEVVPAAGSLTISKAVAGTGAPDATTEFEFLVSKGGAAASGQYSVDGGDLQAIPDDGKISLKAGQTAKLSGLDPGDYTVTETAPSQEGYKSTSFSVNGGAGQQGLTAPVTVTASSSSVDGGWYEEDGHAAPDADGYFTYTITSDQIDKSGNVTVDCDPVAESMEAKMRDNMNWGSRSFKIRFVNESGVAIQYADYSFDTVNWIDTGDVYSPSGAPSMSNTYGFGWGEAWQRISSWMVGGVSSAGSIAGTTGFDGNPIRLAIAPLRCINPAVISFFNSNPGVGTLTGNTTTNSAQTVTFLQMNALPELIKGAFTFKNWQGVEISLPADANRTYADFICAFYGVNSLDDLTVAQKYNVLGTGSKGSPSMPFDGQSAIATYYSNGGGVVSNWCMPYSGLNDGSLDYFRTWGFSNSVVAEGEQLKSGSQAFSADDAATYAYQNDYFLLENDPEVLKMGYDYLYSRCIRFSLNADDRPVPESVDNSATSDASVAGIKEYMDKTAEASANVYTAMRGGDKIASGDTLSLDRVRGYIETPNAWNQFRHFDFGFNVTFKADAPEPPASVAFTNTYEKVNAPMTPGSTATPAAPSGIKPTGLPQTGDTASSAPILLAVAGAVAIAVTVFELDKKR